jgi:hypothetical protein
LYGSTLIAIWQRLLSLNISWDFDVLGKDIRKRGMLTAVVPSTGVRRVITHLFEQSQGLPTHLRCAVQELKLDDGVSQPL